MEDSLYPNAAPNFNETQDDVYVPEYDSTFGRKYPTGVGAQLKDDDEEYGSNKVPAKRLQPQEHDLMDNSQSGREKPIDGYGFMEDSRYPNAAPNFNETQDDVFVPEYDSTFGRKYPTGVGAQHKDDVEEYGTNKVPSKRLQPQEHDLMDNSKSGREKPSDYTLDKIYPNKHLKNILAGIQQSQNGYDNEEEEEKKNKQLNNDSNDNKFGEQKHGRFHRSSDGEAIGGFILWLLIIGGILLCCCLPWIILCVILMRR
uniref:Uncharacterized protein n=1 Tax=Panagrolaimus sp. PS1159 TaxID=55785 RepID=A0AC35FKE0_9BILA